MEPAIRHAIIEERLLHTFNAIDQRCFRERQRRNHVTIDEMRSAGQSLELVMALTQSFQ